MSPAKGWRFGLLAWLWAATCIAAAQAQATEHPAMLLLAAEHSVTGPAEQALGTAPSLEQLAATPAIDELSLSPSGKYVAAYSTGEDRQKLLVLAVDGDAEPFSVAIESWRIRGFRWLPDDRVLLSMALLPERKASSRAARMTRLFVADPAARSITQLLEKEHRNVFWMIQDRLLSLLPHDPEHVLLDLNPNDPRVSQPRLLSLRPEAPLGAATQELPEDFYQVRADSTGLVRVGLSENGVRRRLTLSLLGGDGRWRDHSRRLDISLFQIRGLPAAKPNTLYVVSNHEHRLGALYEFDATTGEFGARLAQHDDAAIGDVRLDHSGEQLAAVSFADDKVPPIYFSAPLRAIEASLARHLPGQRFEIVSWTADYARALVTASASTVPTTHLLYDRSTKRLIAFFSAYDSIEPGQLAPAVRQRFSTRDGRARAIWLTRPAQAPADQPLPFVLIPAAGPAGPDLARFDWLTQLLAREGYGVARLDFDAAEVGAAASVAERALGQVLLDDTIDAAQWLVAQRHAAPAHLAIAGQELGAYLALKAVALAPDLFRSAVSLNGVTDLAAAARRDEPSSSGAAALAAQVRRLWPDARDRRRGAPVWNAGLGEGPLLLVHVEGNQRVSARHARRLRERLRLKGIKHVYRLLPSGSHELLQPANRLAFARLLVEFLSVHLAAAPAEPGPKPYERSRWSY